jgi:hypothetical protein
MRSRGKINSLCGCRCCFESSMTILSLFPWLLRTILLKGYRKSGKNRIDKGMTIQHILCLPSSFHCLCPSSRHPLSSFSLLYENLFGNQIKLDWMQLLSTQTSIPWFSLSHGNWVCKEREECVGQSDYLTSIHISLGCVYDFLSPNSFKCWKEVEWYAVLSGWHVMNADVSRTTSGKVSQNIMKLYVQEIYWLKWSKDNRRRCQSHSLSTHDLN